MKLLRGRFSILVILACASSALCLPLNQNEIVLNEDIYVASLSELAYPPAARMSRTEGVVVVKVVFDGDGNVTKTDAVSGPKALIQDAVANAAKWRFHPNRRNAAVVVYDFQMSGFCPEGSHFVFQSPNVARITGCRFGNSASPGISPN
jgi:TonB family protein